MANVIIPQRFWCRRGTAAALTSANETLYAGEWCMEIDTGRVKIGDGSTAWNSLPYASATTIAQLADVDLTGLADGDRLEWDAGSSMWVPSAPVGAVGAVGCTFDGGGTALAAGSQCDVLVPFDCTITKATILADVAGDIVIDVWADGYATFPPTVADTITAAAPPTIAAAAKSQDTTLTGWTTAITAGTILRFNINSCATITRATIELEVQK